MHAEPSVLDGAHIQEAAIRRPTSSPEPAMTNTCVVLAAGKTRETGVNVTDDDRSGAEELGLRSQLRHQVLGRAAEDFDCSRRLLWRPDTSGLASGPEGRTEWTLMLARGF